MFSRLRSLVVLLCVFVGAVLGVPGVAGATTPAPYTPALSGVNGGSGPSSPAAFGAWRGSTAPVVNLFLPHSTWSDIANPGWGGPDNWKGSGYKVSWAVAMLPQSGGTIQAGATGAYNAYFRQLAQKLVADGQGDADIRLGWEMNGGWMSWSGVNDPTSWVAYWRQVVTAMRAVSPSLTFDWSPSDGASFDAGLLYPGDAYVDEVGMSVYDQSFTFAPSQPVQRWAEVYNGLGGRWGLAWLASFGKAHNKPLAFGEWGLSQRCDGHGGGDDTYFIQQMHTFIANNNVKFEEYFNLDPVPVSVDSAHCELHAISTGTFPQAAALYQQLWSQPFAPVVVPVTRGRTAGSSDVIRVSTNGDRSAPLALDGATLVGPVYVFAVPQGTNTLSVSFYVDRPTTSTPTHVETTAPYDLLGGTTAAAVAFDPGSLSAGTHTLTTVVKTTSGSTTTSTATFTV